jgi:hypothetical protein
MKLDRNIPDNEGCGKYAVINLRRLNEICGSPSTFERWTPAVAEALKTLEEVRCLEWGETNGPNEFFLIKLKDRHAAAALNAYATSVAQSDQEFAREVFELAARSGPAHLLCKEPD